MACPKSRHLLAVLICILVFNSEFCVSKSSSHLSSDHLSELFHSLEIDANSANAESSEVSEKEQVVKVHVFIGQVVHLPFLTNIEDLSFVSGLPKWMMIKNDTIMGIPEPQDVGSVNVTIKTRTGITTTYQVDVEVELENPCQENTTSWANLFWKINPSLESKLHAVQLIRDLDVEMVKGVDTLRVYPTIYGMLNRVVEDIKQENFKGNFMTTWRISCGTLDDAEDVVDDFLDNDHVPRTVRIERGFFKQTPIELPVGELLRMLDCKSMGLENTANIPTTSTTTQTPAKPINDIRLIIKKRVPNFICIKGELCQGHIPLEIFGNSDNHSDVILGVLAINYSDNWIYMEGSRTFAGYPMHSGNFTHHVTKNLENGTVLRAAIQFTIANKPEPSHAIKLDLNQPSCTKMLAEPNIRLDFMDHLTHVLGGSRTSLSLSQIICKDEIANVFISNNSISHDICDMEAIQNFSWKMIGKLRQVTKPSFILYMNAVAKIRTANLILTGSCAKATVNPVITSISTSTSTSTSTSISLVPEPTGKWTMIISILVLVILIFCGVIGVIAFVLHQRRRQVKVELEVPAIEKPIPKPILDYRRFSSPLPQGSNESTGSNTISGDDAFDQLSLREVYI